MDTRLNTPWIALRFGIGLAATLAGLDKFFNLLADWPSYLSPAAVQMLQARLGKLAADAVKDQRRRTAAPLNE
jgi:hypothetical protein